MTDRKTIAVIAPNWLGDAVMSLPLVGMLRAAGLSLTVIAPPATARVYWGLEEVEQLVTLPKRTATRGIAPRSGYLRKTSPDAVVLLPPSFSSAAAPWLAAVPVRVGYATDGRRALLTDSLSGAGLRDLHLSDGFLRLGELAAGRLGLKRPEAFDTPRIRVAEAEADEWARIAASHGVPERYLVVVPGATYGPAKSWPWQRFREAVRRLSEETAVVLAGNEAERSMCGRIADGVGNVFDLAGETSLGVFLALLSGASAVLANDSGSPHMAASLGAPVVVIFGSTSPTWTAPQGPVVDVVRHAVPCSPCFRRTCPTQLECFDGITVDEVCRRTRAAMSSVRYSGGGAR